MGTASSPWHRLPTSPNICLKISSRVKSAGGYKSRGNSDIAIISYLPRWTVMGKVHATSKFVQPNSAIYVEISWCVDSELSTNIAPQFDDTVEVNRISLRTLIKWQLPYDNVLWMATTSWVRNLYCQDEGKFRDPWPNFNISVISESQKSCTVDVLLSLQMHEIDLWHCPF